MPTCPIIAGPVTYIFMVLAILCICTFTLQCVMILWLPANTICGNFYESCMLHMYLLLTLLLVKCNNKAFNLHLAERQLHTCIYTKLDTRLGLGNIENFLPWLMRSLLSRL